MKLETIGDVIEFYKTNRDSLKGMLRETFGEAVPKKLDVLELPLENYLTFLHMADVVIGSGSGDIRIISYGNNDGLIDVFGREIEDELIEGKNVKVLSMDGVTDSVEKLNATYDNFSFRRGRKVDGKNNVAIMRDYFGVWCENFPARDSSSKGLEFTFNYNSHHNGEHPVYDSIFNAYWDRLVELENRPKRRVFA